MPKRANNCRIAVAVFLATFLIACAAEDDPEPERGCDSDLWDECTDEVMDRFDVMLATGCSEDTMCGYLRCMQDLLRDYYDEIAGCHEESNCPGKGFWRCVKECLDVEEECWNASCTNADACFDLWIDCTDECPWDYDLWRSTTGPDR